MPTFESIIHQSLNMPDITASRQLYGVEFVEPSVEQLDTFADTCDRLLSEQQNVLDELDSDFTPKRPAVVYQPSVFLTQRLTPEQANIINEKETPQIAAYCVAVQSELANVPIQESHERLQHIPTMFKEVRAVATFSNIPFPEVSGEWAGKPQEFWAREGFAKRLAIMGHLLNAVGVQLHFIEAFRPVGVQEGMFRRRVLRTLSEHPGWSEGDIIAESHSKTASTPRLASHKGGAAVDILLQDIKTGAFLDFGHEYPDGGVLVFPRIPYVTAEQWHNRQLLQVSSGLSGLSLYVGEDWHISFGDNLASLDEHGNIDQSYTAKYGPIKDFDRATGEITAVYEEDELDCIFDS